MYKPFYIDKITSGLDISVEPRLLQPDGFSTLLNARVEKGKLIKRPSYSVAATTGQKIGRAHV